MAGSHGSTLGLCVILIVGTGEGKWKTWSRAGLFSFGRTQGVHSSLLQCLSQAPSPHWTLPATIPEESAGLCMLRVVPHPFPQPGLIPGTPLCSSPSLRSSGATRSESQSAEPSGPSSDATESWGQEGLGSHSRTQPFSPVFGGGDPDSLVSPEASPLFGALPSMCFWREDIPLTRPSSFHSASSPLRLLIAPIARDSPLGVQPLRDFCSWTSHLLGEGNDNRETLPKFAAGQSLNSLELCG